MINCFIGNGGTETGNEKIKNVNLSKFEDLVDFALKNDVKLVVPGPEQPLVDGVNDVFKKGMLNIYIFIMK